MSGPRLTRACTLAMLWLTQVARADPDIKAWADEARTLAQPEVIWGIAFPAGTHVVESGGPEPHWLISAEAPVALTIHGVAFPAHSVVQFQPRGELKEAKLAGPTTIGAIACAATIVRFHPNNRLATAELAGETTLQAVAFPAHTYLFFDADGHLTEARLSAPTAVGAWRARGTVVFRPTGQVHVIELGEAAGVAGVPLPAGATVAFSEGGQPASAGFASPGHDGPERTHVEYAPDGQPARAALGAPMTLGAITFPRGSRLEFAHGHPRDAHLGEPLTVQEIPLPANTRVFLRDDGSLEWFDLSLATLPSRAAPLVRSIPCSPRALVRLFPNGQLQELTLAAAAVLQGNRLEAGTVVHFRDDGRLDYLDLHWVKAPYVIQSIPCHQQAMVRFHNNGRLAEAELARNTTVQSLPCEANDFVLFHESGTLKRARLAKAATVGGKQYPAHTLLRFDEAGQVVEPR